MNISRLAVLVAVPVLLATAACSGGSDDSADKATGGSSSYAEAPGAADAPAPAAIDEDSLGTTRDLASDPAEAPADPQGAPAAEQVNRAVISTGNLQVETAAIVETRRKALALVEGLNGTVDDEKSGSDGRGRLTQVDLTFRVPAGSFATALSKLADLGTLRDRSQSSKDVTTQVIDINAKVRAQRASVESIERLLARANTIGEIMSVEAQVTRRQAELDSLVQQQRFLADQTAMSTIHLLLDKPPKKAAPPKKTDQDDGFLAGLSGGWHALARTAVVVGTVAGALLPFAVVLALLGIPARVVYRRRYRALA